jgi:hypothetical protein
MQEISNYTFTYEAFPEAMGMLWKRMLIDSKQVGPAWLKVVVRIRIRRFLGHPDSLLRGTYDFLFFKNDVNVVSK